ncbi:MAG: hypothetical protein Q4F07_07090, partial [Bacteroidales bacterium]|nr:hypothetical protein [Bacteroidales bacterium]
MHLKNLPQSVKIAALALLMGTSGIFTTNAAVSYYESMDMGFISNTFRTASGLMATSNRGTEIYLLKDNTLTPVVTGPGAGMYVNVSKDGKLVGFKSIDAKTGDQAPAVMDATTGAVRLLESYSNQCGQVSFADDGTMAYTVGNTLYVVGSAGRHTFNLGLYTNIANISPDGTRVAYCDINGVTYILTVATGNIEQVSNLNSYNPLWSADGKKLAVQQSNGGLYSMDLSTMTVYPLGEASSVKWVDNTNELVITRSERVNDFEVKGASVVKMNFKGGDQTILVSLDESTPVSASLDGKELIVSYASGDLRGVTSTTFSSGVRAGAPAKVRTLLKGGQQRIGGLQANNFMGKSRPDFSRMSDGEIETFESGVRKASAAQAPLKGGTIGLTAIPYINQVWDTPAVGGNYNYGYVCCAPSSSCMMLGYYGKVSPHGVASRSAYAAVKTCNYSWYVSQQYTSCTGYTFSLGVNAGGYWGYSYGVKGGHGYMWGNGSPASHMRYFHTNNGAKSSYYESSNAALDRECNANRPYIMCLNNGTGGHVVCCFRSNQIAANDGSSAWAKTGSFVCHDPYGDYNSSSYPNWDGRYSSYDLPGYSNGRANIGAFYWGCVSNFGDTPQTLKPEITTNPANVHFSCMLNEHPSTTVNVTGKDLSADITIASITPGRFSVSTDKLSKTGGSFTITFNISDKAGTYGQGGTAVDYSFFVRLKSGSTEKVLNITAEVKAPPLETLTEKYNYSRKRNNINDKGYDMSKIRNFCYKDGKLYCVYDSKQILVLNAQTGDKLGFLSNGSVVTPSAATLADVKCIDGVIVASNIALAANGEKLRLYAWENDNAAPYLLLETADFQGSPRIGDCLEMTGSFNTDCWFAFANDWNGQTRIIEYNRKDGNWLAKNTPVYKSDGKTYATGATVRAYPKGGGWWIDGKNSQPAWTTWDDSKQGAVVQTTCDVDFVRGSSHHEFYWKGYKYAANLNFTDNNGTNCKMRIVQDPTGNFSQKTEQGQYPSDGLGDGSNANTNGTGDVMINTDGQTYLEAWVLSTNHGLAYFTTGSVPAQNPQPINPTEETKDPVLSANPTSLSLAANVGEASNDKITVTGTNLQGSIAMYLEGNDASSFSISPTGLSASGEVNVNYHPSAAGDHNTTLVITSPNAADVRVSLSGTASAKEEFVDDIPATKIQTVWESSQNAGTKSWHNATDGAANYARAIAYQNGKLYVVQNKA